MKKKGVKGKSKKVEKKPIKEEKLPQKIDFSIQYKNEFRPILIKVKHKYDTYTIFTEAYKNSIQIKEEISKIKQIPIENIKLFLSNKRVLEDDSMNHDQQIVNDIVIHASFKNSETKEWEGVNEILNFNPEE